MRDTIFCFPTKKARDLVFDYIDTKSVLQFKTNEYYILTTKKGDNVITFHLVKLLEVKKEYISVGCSSSSSYLFSNLLQLYGLSWTLSSSLELKIQYYREKSNFMSNNLKKGPLKSENAYKLVDLIERKVPILLTYYFGPYYIKEITVNLKSIEIEDILGSGKRLKSLKFKKLDSEEKIVLGADSYFEEWYAIIP